MPDNQLSGAQQDADDKKPTRRMSEAEWATVIELYELGTRGIVELAEEYKISRQSISKRFKDDGVVKGSRAGEVAVAVQQAALAATAQTAAKAERYAEKRSEWIEETRTQGYLILKQATGLLNKRVLDIYKTPGATAGQALEDLKALKVYQDALINNIDFRLNRLLNANEILNEEELPNLSIQDLTTQDIVDNWLAEGIIEEDTDLTDIIVQIEQVQSENAK